MYNFAVTKKLLVGAHASIANGFVAAAEHTQHDLGGNALQIFLKSPRGGGACKLSDTEAAAYREYVAREQIFTVAHGSYLLNFAKDLMDKPWQMANLIDDLTAGAKLGVAGVVLHIGKSLELTREEGLAFVVRNIQKILEKTADSGTKILLENTAGQGSELGYRFEELAVIFDALKKTKRIGICFDTCHAFAAGYDLRTPATVAATFAEFDKQLGLEHIHCIHFNDAKSAFESRVDRHASLGAGTIGVAGLSEVARLGVAHGIPLILETPDETKYAAEIALIKQWVQ